MAVGADTCEARDDREHQENEADHLMPERVYGLHSGGENVAHEELPLLNGILIHRVAGKSFEEHHAFILAPAMKRSGETADIGIK